MNTEAFLRELALDGRMLSIILAEEAPPGANARPSGGCVLGWLNAALSGDTIAVTAQTKGCPGAPAGFGFADGLPEVKGGFGSFLTCGRGEGFPPGERVKASAAVAEQMIARQPKNVLDGHEAIVVKPYAPGDSPRLVSWLANPDQLSALIHLYSFKSPDYDRVIVPMSAGCASVFRIPLGEANRAHPRAVVGNADIFSRPHFPADTFFFTIPHEAYLQMLEDADTCFFNAPIWKAVRARIHAANGE